MELGYLIRDTFAFQLAVALRDIVPPHTDDHIIGAVERTFSQTFHAFLKINCRMNTRHSLVLCSITESIRHLLVQDSDAVS